MSNTLTNKQLSIDEFISRLYCKAASIPLESFSVWALDLLQQVVPFDGAIWATGHVATEQFHTHTCVDVSPELLTKLKQHLAINPIFPTLLENKGKAIDMADVIDDKDFYQSKLYLHCFKPFDIERILSSIHLDERSGIFTLLTLYRFDRNHSFTNKEKLQQNQLLFHLLKAASHRQIIALSETDSSSEAKQLEEKKGVASALCDNHGIYHAVEASFLDLVKPLGDGNEQALPFTLADKPSEFSIENLHVSVQKYADLFRLTLRSKSLIDDLTPREKQVVDGICQGSTFKQIAKQLEISPSTVSNHLYRIYDKLNINSRSELVALVQSN